MQPSIWRGQNKKGLNFRNRIGDRIVNFDFYASTKLYSKFEHLLSTHPSPEAGIFMPKTPGMRQCLLSPVPVAPEISKCG